MMKSSTITVLQVHSHNTPCGNDDDDDHVKMNRGAEIFPYLEKSGELRLFFCYFKLIRFNRALTQSDACSRKKKERAREKK
jgi:hypothetical protein